MQNVIDYIREFESLQVNIGRQVSCKIREEKIKRFKDKYDYFVMGLNSNINKAHEINSKIIKFLKLKRYLGIIIGIIFIFAILYWSYTADNKNFLPIVATVTTPFIVLIIDLIKRKDE